MSVSHHLRIFRWSRTGTACMAGALVVLAGCATRAPAPVIERSPAATMQAPGAPVPGAVRGAVREHVVRRGETVYSIALEYGQDYKDVIVWNGLGNPNLIRVGQVLQVGPPAPPPAPPLLAEPVPPPPLQGSPVPAQDAGQGMAQTVPVITGTVEQRTLGPSTVIPTPLMTVPVGEKRPWSDAALAELSKPASRNVAAAPSAAVAPAAEATATPAPPAPPVEGRVAGNDASGIGWIWPATGRTIEEFNEARNKGIDLAGRAGDTVIAAGDGRVVYAGSGLRGYGNLVIIKHDNDYLSAYAHNRVILVKEQQAIKKGQKIAEMGNTDADQVKLHFEIRHQGKPVDPMRYLPAR